MARPRILCFGAGGHAAVVVDLVHALTGTLGRAELMGMIAPRGGAPHVLGVPVLGDDDDLERLIGETGATHFTVALGTVRGGGALRPRLFEAAKAAGLAPFTAIHPAAVVSPRARIGEGATIMAGAVVQARVEVGANAIVNTRASIDHDCLIEDHAHVAPGAVCSGGVRVGARAHVGVGATIAQNVGIGNDATVGAGAAVIRDCAPGLTVVGVPAGATNRKADR